MRKSSWPRPHRREADAAVAHHQRRHAVPARRRQHRVPGDLPVVVRVHVDPAGRDQEILRVDLAPPALPTPSPTAAIDAAVDRDVARRSAARPVPSTTVPLRITRSCMSFLLLFYVRGRIWQLATCPAVAEFQVPSSKFQVGESEPGTWN